MKREEQVFGSLIRINKTYAIARLFGTCCILVRDCYNGQCVVTIALSGRVCSTMTAVQDVTTRYGGTAFAYCRIGLSGGNSPFCTQIRGPDRE